MNINQQTTCAAPKAPTARDLSHIQNLMTATKEINDARNSVKDVIRAKLNCCSKITLLTTSLNQGAVDHINGFIVTYTNGSQERYNATDNGFGFGILYELFTKDEGKYKFSIPGLNEVVITTPTNRFVESADQIKNPGDWFVTGYTAVGNPISFVGISLLGVGLEVRQTEGLSGDYQKLLNIWAEQNRIESK